MTTVPDMDSDVMIVPHAAANEADAMAVAQVGLDDGYAYTKVALPEGRLLAIPSRARIGCAAVTWIQADQPQIFEYETEGTRFSVGAVDGESTRFSGYPHSGLHRAIVQHALQQAQLGGRSIHVVSGLPVAAFYRDDGAQRRHNIQQKRESLKIPVRPVPTTSTGEGGRLSVSIGFHEVIPQALAAWYDQVIVTGKDGVTLDEDRINAPMAIVDIGGRTTDYVVVQDQGIVHRSSGSLNQGLLDVQAQVSNNILAQFDLDSLGEQCVAAAVAHQRVRLHGQDHDISSLVRAAKRELVERLHAETRRHLGLGAELDRIVFVGGGSAALATEIADWFPNQTLAEHPAFANARGMLKYLQTVCEEVPDVV